MASTRSITNLQAEMLKLFQYDLSEKQLKEIKSMLSKYFAKTATEEMDRLWEENNWDNDTMKGWADEHLRKK